MVRYHGRIMPPGRGKSVCIMCGRWMVVKAKSKEFCGSTCRKRFERAKRKGTAPRRGPNRVVTYEEVFPPEPEPRIPFAEPFTDVDVLAASDGRCAECYERIDPAGPVMSGWLRPLDAGGSPVLGNRVPLHIGCKNRWEARSANGRAGKARVKAHR